uniref:Uncharacterized protein n=1 Tax=Siphoviridae sp. ctb1k4 TaxID=2826391 RepID=A0A8S5MV59_9CAUD|nr:MAG TPA: hypothetical protein [Siphoviridae sp. ctb1k4]DAZ55924.1 MAG TPA: hypothetical protein [Caudoviricetes sp.]
MSSFKRCPNSIYPKQNFTACIIKPGKRRWQG